MPLRVLETIFRTLLPPACREHILGDLHEKCKTSREYILEAASVFGPVVISRIRRTTDVQAFFVEALAAYGSFVAAAFWLRGRTFLYDHAGFARLADPTGIIAVLLLFCNAYANPEREPSRMTPVLQTLGCVAFALLGQALLFEASAALAIPFEVMLYGGCATVVVISTLRSIFPPIGTHHKA